jgi:retinol dehydrogenase-12
MMSFKLLYPGHFYFTKLLLPALISGAQSTSDGKARVVTLSSLAAYFSPRLDLDLTKDSELNKKRKKTSGMTLYGHSKLVCIHFRLYLSSQEVLDFQGNILFSNALAKRYGDQGIISSAVHPGAINSDLYRNMSWIETLFMVSSSPLQ